MPEKWIAHIITISFFHHAFYQFLNIFHYNPLCIFISTLLSPISSQQSLWSQTPYPVLRNLLIDVTGQIPSLEKSFVSCEKHSTFALKRKLFVLSTTENSFKMTFLPKGCTEWLLRHWFIGVTLLQWPVSGSKLSQPLSQYLKGAPLWTPTPQTRPPTA